MKPGPAAARWLMAFATGVFYYALARLGLIWAEGDSAGWMAWPAAGVGVAGVLLIGWPATLAVLIATLAATYQAQPAPAANLLTAAGYALAAHVGGMLLGARGAVLGFEPTFKRTRDVLTFVFAGALAPAVISSSVGAVAVVSGGGDLMGGGLWLAWLIADALGALIVGPMLLSWWSDRAPLTRRQRVHFEICLMAAVALGGLPFLWRGALLHTYVLFPLLAWAALAFRARGASLVLVVLSTLLITYVSTRLDGVNLLFTLIVQQFLTLAAVTALIISAVVSERDRLTELREAERELRASQARLTLALEASRMGDWTWDAASDVVTCSPHAARVFGVPPGPLFTWTRMREMLHADDRQRVSEAIERAVVEHSAYDIEYRIARPDGAEAWVAAKGHGQYDAHGRPSGMVGVVQDVTERRTDEEVVRRREAKYRFLNELAEATRDQSDPERIMVTVTEQLGRALRASRCAYADVGSDQDRFTVRHDFTDGVASSRGEYRLSSFGPRGAADILAGRTLVVRDVGLDLEGGEGGAMLAAIGVGALICCPLLKEGRLTAMMAVHQQQPRNWTSEEVELVEAVVERSWAYIESARAHAALRESEARLRAIVETAVDGIITIDERGRVGSFNPAAQRIFGYRPEEVAEKNIKMLMPPPYQQEHDGYLRAYLETGVRKIIGLGREVLGRRKDGSIFPMELAVSETILGDRRIFTGIVRDITERKRGEQEREQLLERERAARAEAEQANRSKDQFLAVLSHELRTPLTPVLTLAQVLERREDVAEDVRDDLKTIRRNVELEARLIDDLLDLTRIARGKLELHLSDVDLHEKLRHIVRMLERDVSSKQIRLTLKPWATRSRVTADGARLQQVVWNLLSNALKFTPPGGWVEVRTANVGDDGETRILLEVEDGGIGIEPEVLPRIFDAFEQGDPSVTRQFGGLGLGLAISKALVDLHGGSLRAASAGRNQGTTVTLELPAAQQAAEPRRSRDLLETAGGQRKRLRILLVEDHEDTARILVRLLASFGHEVSRAGDVATAVRLAEERAFDVVLSDVGLPDGTGHELIRRIRERQPVRAVALSGYGMEEDVRRSLEAGFEEHLIKPVNLDRLMEVLERLGTPGR